jgi:hypothetical protein
MPHLHSDDIVYLAGPPALVAKGAYIAQSCGARWYADPFQPHEERRLLARAANWISRIASPPIVPGALSGKDISDTRRLGRTAV